VIRHQKVSTGRSTSFRAYRETASLKITVIVPENHDIVSESR